VRFTKKGTCQSAKPVCTADIQCGYSRGIGTDIWEQATEHASGGRLCD